MSYKFESLPYHSRQLLKGARVKQRLTKTTSNCATSGLVIINNLQVNLIFSDYLFRITSVSTDLFLIKRDAQHFADEIYAFWKKVASKPGEKPEFANDFWIFRMFSAI